MAGIKVGKPALPRVSPKQSNMNNASHHTIRRVRTSTAKRFNVPLPMYIDGSIPFAERFSPDQRRGRHPCFRSNGQVKHQPTSNLRVYSYRCQNDNHPSTTPRKPANKTQAYREKGALLHPDSHVRNNNSNDDDDEKV